MERGFSLPSELHPGVQDELNVLLNELQGEGHYESSGRFTVNFRAGQEKLRRYRLRQPEEYILKMVQAAVCRCATRADVECWSNTLSFRFDGEPYSLEELEGLAHNLVHESFHSEERDQRHNRAGEQPDDQRARPPLVVAADPREHEHEQPGGEERRARPVDARFARAQVGRLLAGDRSRAAFDRHEHHHH